MRARVGACEREWVGVRAKISGKKFLVKLYSVVT